MRLRTTLLALTAGAAGVGCQRRDLEQSGAAGTFAGPLTDVAASPALAYRQLVPTP
jgi:hypothetical protein